MEDCLTSVTNPMTLYLLQTAKMDLDFSNVSIDKLVTHYVGNKGKDEPVRLSEIETDIKDDTLDMVVKYFFSGFNFDEHYQFSHPVELKMNEMYQVVQKMFGSSRNFMENTQAIANLLYQYSQHPKIKSGELNVAVISNLISGSKKVNAIGIYKSESPLPFLKMQSSRKQYSIKHDTGYDIDRVDKACLIINTDEETGYQVLLADTNGRKEEAQYWKDEFLQVKPVGDSYHFTNNILSVAKNFITSELPKYEVDKTTQVDYLNKSVAYFKDNDTFNIGNFQEQVFNDSDTIEKFQQFGATFTSVNNMEIADSFHISPQAVKKQQRIFKSVLKLDKNFHVYIHGNTDLIEKGFDEHRGKHFYKIYFEEEQ